MLSQFWDMAWFYGVRHLASRRSSDFKKRIIRIITNSHPRSSCKPLFQNLKILTLTGLYLYKLMIYIHSIEHKLPDEIRFNHTYSTRNAHIFRFPNHNLTPFEKSPLYAVLRVYNSLPLLYKNMSLSQLKVKLKNELTYKQSLLFSCGISPKPIDIKIKLALQKTDFFYICIYLIW
jgi:hypothetical protein